MLHQTEVKAEFTKPEITFFCEADGHTYWLEGEELWAAPTNVDGTYEFDSPIYVDDFDDPITPEMRAHIVAILKAPETAKDFYWDKGDGVYRRESDDAVVAVPVFDMPKVGDRIILKTSADRFPDFIAPEGARGIVTQAGDDLIVVKMDEKIAGAEGWNNEVQFPTFNAFVARETAAGLFHEEARLLTPEEIAMEQVAFVAVEDDGMPTGYAVTLRDRDDAQDYEVLGIGMDEDAAKRIALRHLKNDASFAVPLIHWEYAGARITGKASASRCYIITSHKVEE